MMTRAVAEKPKFSVVGDALPDAVMQAARSAIRASQLSGALHLSGEVIGLDRAIAAAEPARAHCRLMAHRVTDAEMAIATAKHSRTLLAERAAAGELVTADDVLAADNGIRAAEGAAEMMRGGLVRAHQDRKAVEEGIAYVIRLDASQRLVSAKTVMDDAEAAVFAMIEKAGEAKRTLTRATYDNEWARSLEDAGAIFEMAGEEA